MKARLRLIYTKTLEELNSINRQFGHGNLSAFIEVYLPWKESFIVTEINDTVKKAKTETQRNVIQQESEDILFQLKKEEDSVIQQQIKTTAKSIYNKSQNKLNELDKKFNHRDLFSFVKEYSGRKTTMAAELEKLKRVEISLEQQSYLEDKVNEYSDVLTHQENSSITMQIDSSITGVSNKIQSKLHELDREYSGGYLASFYNEYFSWRNTYLPQVEEMLENVYISEDRKIYFSDRWTLFLSDIDQHENVSIIQQITASLRKLSKGNSYNAASENSLDKKVDIVVLKDLITCNFNGHLKPSLKVNPKTIKCVPNCAHASKYYMLGKTRKLEQKVGYTWKNNNSQLVTEVECILFNEEPLEAGFSTHDLQDINECTDSCYICGAGACDNIEGSYICQCHKGYELSTENGIKNCTDTDECSTKQGLCGKGTCTNTAGSYTCKCDDGYNETIHIGINTCTDIDECSLNADICGEGKCGNTVGSYTCSCKDGYEITTADGKDVCTDKDECKVNYGICNEGTCDNTDGSYTCTCKAGYTLTTVVGKQTCTDSDECSGVHPCGEGTCINRRGSYTCSCHQGYKLTTLEGRKTCINENECEIYIGICGYGECTDTEGSYNCLCHTGFTVTTYSGKKTCTDRNECVETRHICGKGRCVNEEPYYFCICKDGYEFIDETTCTDINECAYGKIGKKNCRPGQCHNTDGGYTCDCSSSSGLYLSSEYPDQCSHCKKCREGAEQVALDWEDDGGMMGTCDTKFQKKKRHYKCEPYISSTMCGNIKIESRKDTDTTTHECQNIKEYRIETCQKIGAGLNFCSGSAVYFKITQGDKTCTWDQTQVWGPTRGRYLITNGHYRYKASPHGELGEYKYEIENSNWCWDTKFDPNMPLKVYVKFDYLCSGDDLCLYKVGIKLGSKLIYSRSGDINYHESNPGPLTVS